MKFGRLVVLWWDDWYRPGARRMKPDEGLGYVYAWNAWAGPLEVRWLRAAQQKNEGRT